MALQIKVDPLSSQEQQVTLNGLTIFFKIYVNNYYKTNPYVLEIKDQDKNILLSRRIVAGSNFSYIKEELSDLLNGYIFCINTTSSRDPLTTENFGTDKKYQLQYYTKEELENGSSGT